MLQRRFLWVLLLVSETSVGILVAEGIEPMPLSDVTCRNARPGPKLRKLSDGGGLQLWVQPTGGRLWRLAYRFGGKQKLLLQELLQPQLWKQSGKGIHCPEKRRCCYHPFDHTRPGRAVHLPVPKDIDPFFQIAKQSHGSHRPKS